MPYYNVTVNTLYQSCMKNDWGSLRNDDPFNRALAWVEAENVYEMWTLVQKWFEVMESGEAIHRYPDPFWRDDDYPGKVPLTQDVADKFIEEMDADFYLEKSRFRDGQGIMREPPDFSRLPPHARLAFVQDAYKIIKTSSEIRKEAEERLAAGETLPPPTHQKLQAMPHG